MTDLFDHPREVADEAATEKSDSSRRGAERRRRAKHRAQRRRNAISFVVMLIALALLVGGAWVLVRPLLTPDDGPTTVSDYPGPGHGEVQVIVEEGDSGGEIAETLVDANVVATPGAFVSAFNANPDASSIQPGTYTLQEEMRADYAVAMMLDPASRADNLITIPEGWRAEQILERIASRLEVDLSDVESAAETVAADRLPEEADGMIEGWLAAGRYSLHPDDTPQALLEEMVDRTVQMLDDAEVPAADREDVLIKASIIEAEVFREDDRARVARVIENSLDGCSGDGRLRMDSTVSYGLGIPLSEALTQERLNEDTPYNTRLHPGLPPGPINSPSEASLEAALHPASGDWCYFVTVNLDDGDTRFAETLEEHEDNVQLLREWEEENR